MEQYISKSAVVAEIEKLKKLNDSYKTLKTLDPTYCEGLDDSLDNVLSFIDTLEVKEVDLEKEIDNYIDTKEVWEIQEAPLTSIENAAKHFFELGLKVQKGEH